MNNPREGACGMIPPGDWDLAGEVRVYPTVEVYDERLGIFYEAEVLHVVAFTGSVRKHARPHRDDGTDLEGGVGNFWSQPDSRLFVLEDPEIRDLVEEVVFEDLEHFIR